MNNDDDKIISGAEPTWDVPQDSVGKMFIDYLRKQNPDNIICVHAITKDTLTCKQLLEDSIKTVSVFENLGIEKGDTIALICETTVNYFVPIIAALCKGITINAINSEYLSGELKHAFSISKPKLVLCSEMVVENVLQVKKELEFIKMVVLMNTTKVNHLNVEIFSDLLNKVTVDIENFEPETFDVAKMGAFILLSSGTSGLPKGVFLTHQNIILQILNFAYLKFMEETTTGTVVLLLPLYHIFGIQVHMSAILASIRIVLLNKFKPNSFLASIEEYKATKLFVVPALLQFLINDPLVAKYDISSLTEVLCGASFVGKQLHLAASKRLYPTKVTQGYGITESSGACTIQTGDTIKMGSVGQLVPWLTAKVWNVKSGKNVGPLETGEICFKGPIVMKKYVGNTASSQECFDKDGFYHSGDIGFYDEDGYFFLVDRIKELIKHKGFQVSPVEIEQLVLAHPAVQDCGVIGIPDERAEELPLAYVVLRNGIDVKEEDIVKYVAERISAHKRLHGGVIFTTEIPKNRSGKILRRKLLDMYNSGI